MFRRRTTKRFANGYNPRRTIMAMPQYSEGTAILYGEAEKAEILRQLDRLLSDPHLSHSKRFPSFLRFIVQEELEGRGDQLKERTIGVEVFGRDANYDTTSDPIVRVTATEIRKRIAQYYQDSGSSEELRISLPPGSYVPHFEWTRADAVAPLAGPSVIPGPQLPLSAPVSDQPSASSDRTAATARHAHALWPIAAGVLLLVLGIAGWSWMSSRPSALDRFWAPVLSSGDPVAVCFPQSRLDGITLRDAADPLQQRRMNEQMNGVIRDDLQPLVSISSLLEMRHQRYNLMGEDTTTLTDLRQGPAIFIGAFDNAWTLRLTRGLRFRFGNDPQMAHFWIEDTQSPAQTHWGIDRNVQEATNNYRDYAIVARFRDANTGKLAVVAAGIARGGTVAAGEFLTQPADMDAVRAKAPRNWAGENMEFVLSTEIIDGRSAPPKIEATYFW
jgi:hypothetical protein